MEYKLGDLAIPVPTRTRENIRAAYAVFHGMPGVRPSARLLTDVDGSAKAEHSLERGDLVTMLYLAPARTSGVANVCPWSTPQCRAGCLYESGRSTYDPRINVARVNRTRFLFGHPAAFGEILAHEISLKVRKYGDTVGVRLNGTSDICWETVAPWITTMFPDTQFYDYTKAPAGSRVLPPNYDLTYSVSERPTELGRSERHAVVFSTKRGDPLPSTYEGLEVIDGDLSDARFKDGVGVVIGLRAKGPMRKLPVGGMVKEGNLK